MHAGNWICSPDGIIIGKTGRLLQGQHRLMAIIKSGVTCKMIVWRGVDDDVFRVLDRGKTRSASDALGIGRKLAEVGSFLAGLACKTVTDDDIKSMCDLVADEHDALMEAASSSVRVMSSAPIRAAACVLMIAGYDKTHVCDVYRNLVLGHISNLPPVAQAFVGWSMNGKSATSGGARQHDLFARAMVFLDKNKAELSRTQVSNLATAINHARKIISFAGTTSDTR
jgi:hypothetical protein